MKKKILILTFIIIGILTLLIFNYKDPRSSAVKTIYVDDSTVVDDKLIWDKNKNLIRPEALAKLLGKGDSLIERKTELNGHVIYVYKKGKDSLLKKKVFKSEYNKEDFYVSINNDSINNNVFIAEVGFNHVDVDKYSITIYNDSLYEIEEFSYPKSYKYLYKADSFPSNGVYDFNGTVLINGTEHHFQYSYLVF